MPPPSRFLRHLENELPQWVNEGLVSHEQAGVLRDRYARGMPAHAWTGRLVTTISTLGAVLLGVGVILFFAANWQAIPRSVKLLLILVGVVLSEGSGYVLRDVRRVAPRSGEALLLVGVLLYGAGIFLTAQMYHVDASRPVWVLLWALPLFPLAYVLSTYTLLVLGAVLLFMWAGWDIVSAAAHVGTAVPATFLTIASLGAAFDGVGLLHALRPALQAFGEIYRRLGLLAVAGVVYILSFRFVHEFARAPESGLQFRLLAWAALAVGLLIAALVARRSSWVVSVQAGGVLATLATMTLILFLFLVPSSAVDPALARGDVVLPTLLSNLLLAAVIVGILVVGYRVRETWLVNFGIALFALTVIARYFDFFWELIDRSLFFIGGGLVLLVGGYVLERQRRKILEQIRAGVSQPHSPATP